MHADRGVLLLAHDPKRSAHPAGSVSGLRSPASCSPWPIAFPPPPPQVPRAHPCSAASPVLRDRPTSHGRTCRKYGRRPFPADPPHHQRVPVGSPVSRAKSFHACSGSQTPRRWRPARRSAPSAMLPSPSPYGVGTPIRVISELNGWPACAPVNASPASSRPPTHDSGSG